MLGFVCEACGGDMKVHRTGELVCPYCGVKNFFTDKQLAEYKEYRLRMLEYLSAVAEDRVTSAGAEAVWNNARTITFQDAEGDDITIQYLYHTREKGVDMYSARNNVIYIYPVLRTEQADKAIRAFSRLAFPQADMKGLGRCFPKLAGDYKLKNGSRMLVYSKEENFYPLGLFGDLIPEHVEWMISRLENIACVLLYNEMEHGGISKDSVFINPKTHEAALLGGWENAHTGVSSSEPDLKAIRQVAGEMLGDGYKKAPKPLIRFIESKPASIAYEDFANWDKVIETQLGGRHFTKFEME